MMQDTSYRQVIEPPSVPLDLRDTAFAGRIHEVDPQAVAKFKEFLAAEAATAVVKKPQKTAVVKKQKLVGFGFNNRLPKPEAVKEQEMAPQSKLSDEQIMAAHRRYVIENLPIASLVARLPIEETPLMNQFKRRGLPCRGRNRRWQSDDDVARVCKVHGIEMDDIPFASLPITEQAVKTAVSPVTGNVSSDLPVPAPASNGRSLELTSLHEQLAAVQSLMEMAQAKAVQVSGTIRLNLVVDITL